MSNDWTFYPVDNGVVERKEFEVIDRDGNVATMAALTANAQKQLTKMLPDIPEPVEEAEIKVRFPGEGLLLRSTATGNTVPVNFAIAKLRYTVKQEIVPFRLVQYKAKNSDEHITDAAYADMTFDEKKARLMIVYKDSEGGKVVLIPKEDKDA